jgi:hypothetical protein
MWHTVTGDRVLESWERAYYVELMAAATNRLVYLIEDYGESDLVPSTGDRMFDSASLGEKVVLLRSSLQALIDPLISIPDPQCFDEAAAYFPFAFLLDAIDDEIGAAEPGGDYWRAFLCRIHGECCETEGSSPYDDFDEELGEEPLIAPTRTSVDLHEFYSMIEDLANRIFWDRDWQVTSCSPEVLDGVQPEIEAQMGFGDNYFSTKLPKANRSQIVEAINYIYSLVPGIA